MWVSNSIYALNQAASASEKKSSQMFVKVKVNFAFMSDSDITGGCIVSPV